jgi:hypothetical protein
MLRDTVEGSSVESGGAELAVRGSAPTWAPMSGPASGQTQRTARPTLGTDLRTEPHLDSPLDWRTVDRALRAIRGRRAALDAEEARWLRIAEDLQIWRPLGMVSALDYLERVLGYAPRTAQDRLRVARALGALPGLSSALASDDLSYSAVRELTRVAMPGTEVSWIAAAKGKNLRQIEDMVADHKPGDRPDDPPDPEARMRVVRFELSPETFALFRQARSVLDDGSATEPTGRAKFQIAVTVCSRCHQGWQEGAGAQVAIDAAAVERAMCDAQHIGSLDGEAPERAHQDIPPSVVRFVWRRDGGRCRVPGCRSARGLEVHHIVHRADGGGHEAWNLCVLCSSCHLAHHRGALVIRGTADHLVVRRPGASGASSSGNSTAGTAGPAVEVHAGVDVRWGSDIDAHVGEASHPHQGIDAHVGEASHPHRVIGGRGTGRRGAVGGDGGGASDKLGTAVLHTEAKDALVVAGWQPAVARAAVAAAAEMLGRDATLERLIFESFRRCPKA